MDEIKNTPPVIMPSTTLPGMSNTDRPSHKVRHSVIAGERGFAQLLKEMRAKSGLTTRQIATKMGITRESLNQYFWLKRGSGGTSRMSWFLRYAEACGCVLWLTYPSNKDQVQLKASALKQDEERRAKAV